MGLLGKAIARNNTTSAESASFGGDVSGGGVQTLITDFHQKNPLFHCIVLQGGAVKDIPAMIASHGAVCIDLPGDKCLVLLPGGLDMELFAHRLSKSTASTVLSQSSANLSSLAIETLNPYLQ
jgi:hypothetical protein